MTVGELIKELENFDKDKEVRYDAMYTSDGFVIDGVVIDGVVDTRDFVLIQ